MPKSENHPAPQAAEKPARKPLMPPVVAAGLWTALAAILMGSAALPWFLSDPARLSRLIARAVPGLQADVTVGRARIGWSAPIVIEDIRVVPHNGARPPIAIKRIEGNHGLAAMLLSLGDLGRFRVEGLEADIVFDEARNSNLTGLFVPAERKDRNDIAERVPRSSPVRVRFDVEAAIAKVEGPWSSDPWASDPIDITAKLAPVPGERYSAWTIDDVQLLDHAKLEANVAQGVLAYIAPVMADAARTSGRFSLRIDGATFPVGAPQAARLAGVLSMHEVDLGPGPLVKNMMTKLPGRLSLPTSVRIADDSNVEFHLASRRVWHKGLEFGLPLAKPGQRLDINSSGSVGLDDKSLDLKFALPLPTDLPADRPLLAALAGKSISVGIGGVLGDPKINFDGSIRATAGGVAADLVDRLRRPGQPTPPRPAQVPAPNWVPPQPLPTEEQKATEEKPGAADTAGNPKSADQAKPDQLKQGTAKKLDELRSKMPAEVGQDPAADAVIDLVGGLLDEVAKRRAERAAANAENPQAAPPPRRGRLLRRLPPPPAAEPAPQ